MDFNRPIVSSTRGGHEEPEERMIQNINNINLLTATARDNKN